jgi:methylase of polypeptide subunit release factors
MAAALSLAPIPAADDDSPARLRTAFDRAGFSEPAVRKLLDVAELPARLRQTVNRPDRNLGAAPLSTLARLFLLGEPVSPELAHETLAPLAVEQAVDAGLLRVDGGAVQANFQIIPFQDVHVAADWPNWPAVPPEEPVMGVAASTRALDLMTIRRPGGRALDLGTGSGVLALRAARHVDRVWALDLNPRAVTLARFNAALNGVTNLESRAGDLFEPVAGDTFDLIVCNPPFVIAPTAGRLHSQTGRPADDFCRSIVRAAPTYLRPGGFCQLVANWVHPADGDWRERLAGWFAGLGCDVWALHDHTEDAATYARKRIGELTDDADDAGRMFDEWTAFYSRNGIAAVGFGVITLRKTAGRRGWFRCDPLPPIAGPCGDDIANWFARRDFLEAHRDEHALLAARVRRADDVTWDAAADRLRRTRGLMFAGAAEAGVAAFVDRCAEARCLDDELSRLASEVGRDRRAFAPAFLAVVRRLVEVGILAPEAGDWA